MLCKYCGKIETIGSKAIELLEGNILITFTSDLKDDSLHEFSIGLKKYEYHHEVLSGDYLQIGQWRVKITAVGDKANELLEELSHLTIRLDDSTTALLPGSVHVQAINKSLLIEQLIVNNKFEIFNYE